MVEQISNQATPSPEKNWWLPQIGFLRSRKDLSSSSVEMRLLSSALRQLSRRMKSKYSNRYFLRFLPKKRNKLLGASEGMR